MRDRKKQRKMRKIRKEEKLDTRNSFGIADPTPYLAVKNIIAKNHSMETVA